MFESNPIFDSSDIEEEDNNYEFMEKDTTMETVISKLDIFELKTNFFEFVLPILKVNYSSTSKINNIFISEIDLLEVKNIILELYQLKLR